MKPLYKKFETAKKQTKLLFNLVALLADVEAEVAIADLDRLCVRLVRPGISGALLLSSKNFAGNYIAVNGDEVSVYLATPEGKNRVTVEAEFGTNTRTLAIVDVFTTASESGVFEAESITTPVVKQLDGVARSEFDILLARMRTAEMAIEGKADGEIYRVGESGDPAARDVAKIYGHGLEIGINAEATGLHAVAVGDARAMGESSSAHGRTEGDNSYINAGSDGASAHGYTEGDNSYINADSAGAFAHGYTYGEGSYINAGGAGAFAHGCTDGDNSYINAGSDGASAHGYTSGEGSYIEAGSDGASAHGCTYGEGSYINAGGAGAFAHGRTEGDNSYINAGGAGASAHGYTSGEGSYINAGGAGAFAHGCTSGDGSCIEAGDWGAHAGGVAQAGGTNGYGNVEATSEASFAHGKGVKAKSDCQFVIGRANIVDESDRYALIVGNGTNDANRSNAFAIDWSGNLVLFNNGTPVVLTPAKLAQLIS